MRKKKLRNFTVLARVVAIKKENRIKNDDNPRVMLVCMALFYFTDATVLQMITY